MGPLPPTTIAFNMQNAQWRKAAEAAQPAGRPSSSRGRSAEPQAPWLVPALQLLCDYLVDDDVKVCPTSTCLCLLGAG